MIPKERDETEKELQCRHAPVGYGTNIIENHGRFRSERQCKHDHRVNDEHVRKYKEEGKEREGNTANDVPEEVGDVGRIPSGDT